MNHRRCLMFANQPVELVVCARRSGRSSNNERVASALRYRRWDEPDSQSPRISATQRILPVLPASTMRGGLLIEAAFSVAGGEGRPLTAAFPVDAILEWDVLDARSMEEGGRAYMACEVGDGISGGGGLR